MKFNFKAETAEGKIKEGVIEAASAEVAISVLQQNKLYPISVNEEGTRESITKIFLKYWDRVSAKELMVFFRQFSILIEAKVPINSALIAIQDQSSNVYFKKVIESIVNDVQDGLPLSGALSKNKDVFSSLVINIIRAGEVSGNLKKSLDYVAENIEKTYNLRAKIKSALLYPVIVIIAFFIITFIVISFVLPKLTTIVRDLNAELPWYTKMMIGLGDFMASYWWAVGIIIIGFIGGVIYYINTEVGRREWDQIKIRLPIFGKVFECVYMARMADNLAVLLEGGIPIIKAITVVSYVINNSLYQAVLLRAADEVKIGGNISDVFKKHPLIPPIVAQMIKIGEESGQIDLVLNHIARFYEQEADELTKNLSTLIEPLLMIFIGIAVGFLAISIIMPIYNIAGQF